tara:strand:- start:244 stop:537 length:294 start_codon:yes stop_codon:yes gene_type:complete
MIDSDSYKKAQAINSLVPGADFTLRGLDDLEWNDSRTKPTDSEITAEINRLKNISDYQTPRKREYPPFGEQLDMIYHDIDAWKAKIKETKDKYPKPS